MTSYPSYFDPAQTGGLWIERQALVAAQAERMLEEGIVRPAADDRFRVALLGVDCQVGFVTPGASLQVPGAVDDMTRLVQFIYRNLGAITSLHFSLDTHSVHQIFHSAYWIDEAGNHPAPFTLITAAEVRAGRWRALREPKDAQEYCERLEQTGRKVLTIWPYHTLMGGTSHALVPAVQEAAMLHTLVRRVDTLYEVKGTEQHTESYSVLEPEVKEVGGLTLGEFNARLFESLMEHDAVYVAGEASSHCVAETLASLEREIACVDPQLLGRIHILEDCMSPVGAVPGADLPAMAREALAHFREVGMKVVRSTDPIAAARRPAAVRCA